MLNIKKLERVETIDRLSPGQYDGLWSGDKVKVTLNDDLHYIITVGTAIRGINIRVTVTVNTLYEVSITVKGGK